MTTRDTSLAEFLFPYGHGVPDQVWSKILPRLAFTFILTKLVPEASETAKSEIRNSIGALFQMSPLEILTGAWKKYELVAKALDESKRNPQDLIFRSLAKHTAKSIHHPYLEVLIENRSFGKLEFELTAVFEVEGLTLKIQNGEITEIMTGSCQGSMYLAFEGESLMEVRTQHIALRGSIPLKPRNLPPDMKVTKPTVRNV